MIYWGLPSRAWQTTKRWLLAQFLTRSCARCCSCCAWSVQETSHRVSDGQPEFTACCAAFLSVCRSVEAVAWPGPRGHNRLQQPTCYRLLCLIEPALISWYFGVVQMCTVHGLIHWQLVGHSRIGWLWDWHPMYVAYGEAATFLWWTCFQAILMLTSEFCMCVCAKSTGIANYMYDKQTNKTYPRVRHNVISHVTCCLFQYMTLEGIGVPKAVCITCSVIIHRAKFLVLSGNQYIAISVGRAWYDHYLIIFRMTLQIHHDNCTLMRTWV